MLGCWWWGGGGLWGRLWWRRFAVMGIISLPINLPGTPFNKAIKASNLVRNYLLEIVKQRQIDLAEGKASTVQDMLSHMLATSDHELTKDYEIADKILGLLLGGHGSGSVIEITKLPGYVLETKVKGEVMSTVESELLCRAYFNMYLGDDPFDKEAKENFGASLLALF